MRLRSVILLIFVIGFAVGGCSGSKPLEKEGGDLTQVESFRSGLDAVPSDTIFLIMSNGAVNQDVADKFYSLLASYPELVCSVKKGVRLSGRPSSDYTSALGKVIYERAFSMVSDGKGFPDWSGKVGLDRTPKFIAYGLGVAQVFRVSLSDPALFAQVLDAADKEAGFQVEKQDVNGVTVRFFSESARGSMSAPSILYAIVGNELVVAQVPAYYLETTDFLTYLLATESMKGFGHAPVKVPNPVKLASKVFSGFFSMKLVAEQILNKQTSPSGKLLHEFYSRSQWKLSDSCRGAIAEYDLGSNNVGYMEVGADRGNYAMSLQLPMSEGASAKLSEAMRPPIPENEATKRFLGGKESLGNIELNANLYKLLGASSDILDDEIEIVGRCSGRFDYTRGTLGQLMLPMRSLLERVDSLRVLFDGVRREPNGALSLNSSDPELLLRGLAGLLGLQSLPEPLEKNKLLDLGAPTAFRIPFGGSIYSFIGENRLSFALGQNFKEYVALEQQLPTGSIIPANTPLFSMKFTGFEKEVGAIGKMAKGEVSVSGFVEKKGPFTFILRMNAPNDPMGRANEWVEWRAKAQKECK